MFAKSFKEALQNLTKVFDRLDDANLKLNAKKCCFFRKEVEFLGHIVSREGVHSDPKKIEAIQNIAIPKNVTELRRFLGLMSYQGNLSRDLQIQQSVFTHLRAKTVFGTGRLNVIMHFMSSGINLYKHRYLDIQT